MSELLSHSVSEVLEKKGNLSYLSWAHAWGEALKIDPAATFHVSTFDRGDGVTQVYMDVNGTALVWVTVTLNGKAMTCQLPVMDNKNKAIPNPDAFAVNTAIMRCMVKALALHGLGLYVYAGEDLPFDSDKPEPKPEPTKPKQEAKPLVSTDWKLKVPEGKDKEWADKVSVETAKLLDKTQSKADVMEIFKVNRTVFDQVKLVSKDNFDELMTVFKERKEKYE